MEPDVLAPSLTPTEDSAPIEADAQLSAPADASADTLFGTEPEPSDTQEPEASQAEPDPEELKRQVLAERNRANAALGRQRKAEAEAAKAAALEAQLQQMQAQLAAINAEREKASLAQQEQQQRAAQRQQLIEQGVPDWQIDVAVDQAMTVWRRQQEVEQQAKALADRERWLQEQTRIAAAPMELAQYLTNELRELNATPEAKRLNVVMQESDVRAVLNQLRPGKAPHELTPADVYKAMVLAQQKALASGVRAQRTADLKARAESGVDAVPVAAGAPLSDEQIVRLYADGRFDDDQKYAAAFRRLYGR